MPHKFASEEPGPLYAVFDSFFFVLRRGYASQRRRYASPACVV